MKLIELLAPRISIFMSPDKWMDAVKHVGAKAEVDPRDNHRRPAVIYARKGGNDVGVWIDNQVISAGAVFKTREAFDAWRKRDHTLTHAMHRALKDIENHED